jgi:hypothetical protein
LALAACSNDEIINTQQASSTDGITFRTIMNNSRGQSTTTGNLTSFWASARTASNGSEFANKEYTKNDKGIFASSDSLTKTWPTYTLNFYAISPEHQLNFQESTPRLLSFSPNESIRKQIDLIYATNKGSREDFKTSSVPLKFNHALAQIEIKAICKSTSAYNVHVKGYRIGYVDKTGTFTFPEAEQNKDVTNLATYQQKEGSWSDLVKTSTDANGWGNNYTSEIIKGSSAQGGMLLTDAPQTIAVAADDNVANSVGEGQAMILPQKGDAWVRDNSKDASGNYTNYKMGRYIAVLVQVNYKKSDGSDGEPVYPSYGKEKFAKTRLSYVGLPLYYAYAAVPVAEEWEAGKKYTYILDFSDGCGYVEPEQPHAYNPTDEDGNIIDTDDEGEPKDENEDGIPDAYEKDTDGDGIPDTYDEETFGPDDDGDGVPDEKELDEYDPFEPGNEIIGHPITFQVIVSDWVEAGQTTATTSTITTPENP